MSQPVNLSPQMLAPTVFWRIAEDIPKRLTWILMTLSIAIPMCLWWMISSWGLLKKLAKDNTVQIVNLIRLVKCKKKG